MKINPAAFRLRLFAFWRRPSDALYIRPRRAQSITNKQKRKNDTRWLARSMVGISYSLKANKEREEKEKKKQHIARQALSSSAVVPHQSSRKSSFIVARARQSTRQPMHPSSQQVFRARQLDQALIASNRLLAPPAIPLAVNRQRRVRLGGISRTRQR